MAPSSTCQMSAAACSCPTLCQLSPVHFSNPWKPNLARNKLSPTVNGGPNSQWWESNMRSVETIVWISNFDLFLGWQCAVDTLLWCWTVTVSHSPQSSTWSRGKLRILYSVMSNAFLTYQYFPITMGLLGRNPIISWVVSVIDISTVKRVLDRCMSTEQQPACNLHTSKHTDTFIHIHHFQVQPFCLICLLEFSVPMQLRHWKQNLVLNPSLVNYNPNALHQVCFTHLLWDSWYSLQWLLWILPGLWSWKPTWYWESLLSRNPIPGTVPIALRIKILFLESTADLKSPEDCYMPMDWLWLHNVFPGGVNASAGFSSTLPLSGPGSLILLVRMSQHAMQLRLWIMTDDWKNVRTQRNPQTTPLREKHITVDTFFNRQENKLRV